MNSPTSDDQAAGEGVIIIDIQLEETNRVTFFTVCSLCLFQCFNIICNIAAICGGLVVVSLCPEAYGEEAAAMPHANYALGFIVTCLLGFAGIKSQGDSNFPFQTHPKAVMVSVTSLLMYGLASAVELVVSGARINPSSMFAIIARAGRIASLCILVTSLASLFYF